MKLLSNFHLPRPRATAKRPESALLNRFVEAIAGAGSKRLTIPCFVLLAGGTVVSYPDPAAAPAWTAVPLLLLGLHLGAAMLAHPGLRRGGLLVFHLALLVGLTLAGIGRLAQLSGRVEITDGATFEPGSVEVMAIGPLHRNRLDQVAFQQGPFTVDYAPGLRRAHTRSSVILPDRSGGHATYYVGDDVPLVIDGYRFYTTHNKGYAPILVWWPEAGVPIGGAVHMPSYPMFEWKQDNRWVPDGATEIRFQLQLDQPLRTDVAWTLDTRASGILVVESGGTRAELRPGQSVRLPGGKLEFVRLGGWMGYKVFYDPTLGWLLAIALIGASGLAWHLWRRIKLEPWNGDFPALVPQEARQ